MDGIDLEGLRRFALGGDRDAPPYFAGRRELLDDLTFAAENCWYAWTHGQRKTPGATRVIHGAPGAGKSAILRHLKRLWPGPGGGAPAMLLLDAPADFMNGTALAERLVDLMKPGHGVRLRTEVTRRWNLHGGLPGLGGEQGRDAKASIPDDPIDAALSLVPGERWSGPVAVAVDEFQNAKGDVTSPHAMVLQKLHAHSYRAPIVPVLAGLSDTIGTVDRLGVSRRTVGFTHSVGRMNDDDAWDLIGGWSDRFGVPEGAWRDTMLETARAGSLWPAHTHNALAAFAAEVVRVGGDMDLVDLAKVGEDAAVRRQMYYRDRVSPEMERSKWLLAAVVADFRDGMESGDVIDLIERHARPAPARVRWRLPGGMDATDYYGHILKRGVVQEDRSMVTVPIPCLRNWIAAHCMASVAEDADRIASSTDIPDR